VKQLVMLVIVLGLFPGMAVGSQGTHQSMATDAGLSFDVATIKPNNSGGTSIEQLMINGRSFKAIDASLADLIQFAYHIHMKQIVDAPPWVEKERFDIAGTSDQGESPNVEQMRSMVRKLLADRFLLKLHHATRELSAFVLTVGKSGSKLTPTQSKNSPPGMGMRPNKSGFMLTFTNARTQDFVGYLQFVVLDRPVVDQTGMTERYDFDLIFTPDESLFKGHPPSISEPAEDVEPAPGFFEAIQQQLGLKLTAGRTQVDVLAIDHVEKPSAN
jgi:uncharacterized protein (TIGR03435 family)